MEFISLQDVRTSSDALQYLRQRHGRFSSIKHVVSNVLPNLLAEEARAKCVILNLCRKDYSDFPGMSEARSILTTRALSKGSIDG